MALIVTSLARFFYRDNYVLNLSSMLTTSYTVFIDSNKHRYAIKSDDCTTFATDPGNTRYQMFPIGSKDQIEKEETVSVLRSGIEPAGCIITEPAP